MPQNLSDLQAFLAVARENSFTKAAAKLGVTPSALSHTIKGLEERLGLRLLSRTTRSVAPTAAGLRLAQSIGPHFEEIDAEIAALRELRDKPAGTIRITCIDYVIESIFRPKLPAFLRNYPDIKVELAIDYGLTNIVEQRFDAGVRIGESISKDMIAVRIGPDWRFSVVAAPAYFAQHSPPATPQDLTSHRCINHRLTTAGSLYAWEFEKDGRELNVRVDGQVTFNSVIPALHAAVDGLGLAYVPEELTKPYLEDGRLREVLADWCPTLQGYHLYYPNRRQALPAFSLLVDALRHRA
ncbi:MAG: LysR family transcriptional regulator [Rhodospirillaceae bacterium]|nr:LysR family transcriptional regulator [Rhodospirillaceae bacterium]